MARHVLWLAPALLILGLSLPAHSEANKVPVVQEDLTSRIVRATFKVENPKSTATAWVLTRPAPGKEGVSETVLVTAAHVLNQAEGETVTVLLRSKKGEGQYQKVSVKLPIRKGKKPLWKQHAQADVAAMRGPAPQGG